MRGAAVGTAPCCGSSTRAASDSTAENTMSMPATSSPVAPTTATRFPKLEGSRYASTK